MKRNYFLSIGTIITIVLLIGCNTPRTRVESLKDPSYNGKKFKRILVIGAFEKIDKMKTFETAFVRKCKRQDIFALSNYKTLPPLRDYSDSEKIEVYKKHNFEGYIIISPKGVNTVTYQLPTYTSSTTKIKSGKLLTETETVGGEQSQIIISADYQCELFDFNTGHIIWKCDATTNVKNAKDWTDVASNLSFNVLKKLGEDDLIDFKPFSFNKERLPGETNIEYNKRLDKIKEAEEKLEETE